MKQKNAMTGVSVQQEYFMSNDLWNGCCCVLAPYADRVNMSKFAALNLGGQQLDDLKNNIVFTANYNRQLIGFLVGSVDSAFDGTTKACVDWLFLDSDYHRRKIGETLLNKFEFYVRKKHKVAEIELQALGWAYGFYERMGYTHDSRQYDLMYKTYHR